MNIYYYLFIALLILTYFCVLASALRYKSFSFKTVQVRKDKNIEAKLRILMQKNPRSEIVVINRSASSETGEILRKMQLDFPQIHIVSY